MTSHNLPAEPNRFVGRARDVDELRGLLRDQRLVTLCGVGGIGKTRLALRVAGSVVGEFPDGVWLVELGRITSPDLVAHEIATVLGVREERSRPALDGLRVRLRGARALLLLDNCEQVVERCAELVAELLAGCPDLRILLTTREALRIPGELVWRVPPLDLPDARHPDAEAVLLFTDRAMAAGTRLAAGDFDDVARLCVALDGLPLALELAAARTRMLSPAQIADRIGDRFRLLTTGDRTAPARQRTLLATVEWSHDLLTAKERVLLRRLSVFAGHFDLDLVEQVCADERLLPREEVLDLLGGLVDKSLLLADGGRYRLLETIKEFAGRLLRKEDEHVWFRDRHLQVVCELEERCFEAGLAAPRASWQERRRYFVRSRNLVDDCRVAVDWAVESGNALLGLRLAYVASAMLAVHGEIAEGVDWFERLLLLDLTGVPPEVVALCKGALAYGMEARDDLAGCERVVAEALKEQEKVPHSLGKGVTLNVAGVLLLRTGQLDRAERHFDEVVATTRQHDDTFNRVIAQSCLAVLAGVKGQLRLAQRHAGEALAVAKENGHPWHVAMATSQLAAVAEWRGDTEAAVTHYRAAAAIFDELDNRVEMERCLVMVAKVAIARGDHVTARSLLAECLALAQSTGQRLGMARVLRVLSRLADVEDDIQGSVLASAAAVALAEEMGEPVASGRIEQVLTRARDRLGEGRTALQWSRGRELDPVEIARLILDGRREQGPLPVPAVAEVPHPVLTAREQEIAGLLTRGLSNRAIADELVISPATVARHIANIMEKLGFTSRSQIALWAVEHNLGSA
ncbi:helix-turn-helix transcriptional regulator [Nonomuraea dietziae]|uniref:helix-turn-helix transcriptional regulator n=1 Tax=Nonomuraea dietziae TaxID=65515 RepID=UPI00340957CC